MWRAMLAPAMPVGDWFLAGAVNGHTPEQRPVFFLRIGDMLRLYVVIKACDESFVSTAPLFRREGRAFHATPLRDFSTSWKTITPELRAYDNLHGGSTGDPVQYRLAASRADAGSCTFAAREAGTFLLTVSFRFNRKKFAAPLPPRLAATEPLQQLYFGQVVQIVVRRDGSYLGYLSEMLHTPFIMAPHVCASGFHQTDQRVGSDCAALAIYGRRRAGFDVPYCGPTGIKSFLTPLTKEMPPPLHDGIYRTKNGRSIAVTADSVRPGDIVHFGEQVAVLYSDRGTRGVLDADDIVFESWGRTPHLTTIRRCGFFDHPVRIFRWPETTGEN